MRVFIAGIDGYLGWTLAQYLAARGHAVAGADTFFRRRQSVDGEVASYAAICVPLLFAVDDEVIAVLDGGCDQTSCIRSRGFFGKPKCYELFAFRNGWEVLVLLFFSSAQDDGERTKSIYRERHTNAATCPGELLDDKA